MGLIAHIYIYIFSWLLAEHQSILSVHIFWLLAAGINPRQNPKGTQETVMTFHTSMASIALELSVNVYYAYVSGVYVCVWQHKFVVCAMCVSCVLMCCVCVSLWLCIERLPNAHSVSIFMHRHSHTHAHRTHSGFGLAARQVNARASNLTHSSLHYKHRNRDLSASTIILYLYRYRISHTSFSCGKNIKNIAIEEQ